MTLKISITFLFLFASVFAFAQFELNGSARVINDSCYQLTEAREFQVGSIWNLDKVNLNESFEVIMTLNFGNLDQNGADGIFFGFQPVSTSIGEAGEGIGFGNISPALGIEFDTYQNFNRDDPAYDHIAIQRDGNVTHSDPRNLAGPVQASATRQNIEDGEFHELRVSWDAQRKFLEVFFDCTKRIDLNLDIVNEIFRGNPFVFWGFTAATGGAINVHEVCFSYVTFLDGFEDVTICPGGRYQLEVSGGENYRWTPSTGLSNPNISNPIASPEETTTYFVEVTDDCGNPFGDTITVFVDGDTVFFDLGVDTMICENEQLLLNAETPGNREVYTWSTGSTGSTEEVLNSGRYAVTVVVDDYCIADDEVFVEVTPLPIVELGADTLLCPSETLILRANSPFADVEWQNGSTIDSFFVNSPGTYRVEAENKCGGWVDDITVNYKESCRQVYIANAFSPNEDDRNDVFLVQDQGDVQNVDVFRIYDRYGNMLFEALDFLPNDPAFGWDGTFRGKLLDSGSYVWQLEVSFQDGSRERYSGSVALLR